MFGFANPKRYEKIKAPIMKIASLGAVLLIPYALYLALLISPPDYQQSENVRIMYVHVPSAWMSMFIYAGMAASALIYLIWKHTLAGFYIAAAAPIGATFTAICLITGSLWGYRSWGTWWEWDARMTSVLVLFFIYLGIIALGKSFDDPQKGEKARAWLTLIGAVNLPIIKFSVDWWNTLHQPASLSSLSRMTKPAIDPAMLSPLLCMAGGFLCLFIALAILRLDTEILRRKLHVRRIMSATGRKKDNTDE